MIGDSAAVFAAFSRLVCATLVFCWLSFVARSSTLAVRGLHRPRAHATLLADSDAPPACCACSISDCCPLGVCHPFSPLSKFESSRFFKSPAPGHSIKITNPSQSIMPVSALKESDLLNRKGSFSEEGVLGLKDMALVSHRCERETSPTKHGTQIQRLPLFALTVCFFEIYAEYMQHQRRSPQHTHTPPASPALSLSPSREPARCEKQQCQ